LVDRRGLSGCGRVESRVLVRAAAGLLLRGARGAGEKPEHHLGYWRQPELTKAVFDDDRYYKFGDALRFVDENDPERGFLFDGRVAEDFKLATGTWVSVGPLTAKFVAHCAPYVTDVVIAGHDRDDASALVIPNLAACRELVDPTDDARAFCLWVYAYPAFLM
jgi:long-subunit acyl-CoA synthetase (AMP-forming)